MLGRLAAVPSWYARGGSGPWFHPGGVARFGAVSQRRAFCSGVTRPARAPRWPPPAAGPPSPPASAGQRRPCGGRRLRVGRNVGVRGASWQKSQ